MYVLRISKTRTDEKPLAGHVVLCLSLTHTTTARVSLLRCQMKRLYRNTPASQGGYRIYQYRTSLTGLVPGVLHL